MNRVPPKAAPYSRTGDEWIKRARTSPPRGASRPRFLRATGPPQGLLPAVTPTPKARAGTRVACVESSVGFGVGSSVGFGVPRRGARVGPGEPASGWAGQGCGACQRSSSAEGASMWTAIPARLEVPACGNCRPHGSAFGAAAALASSAALPCPPGGELTRPDSGTSTGYAKPYAGPYAKPYAGLYARHPRTRPRLRRRRYRRQEPLRGASRPQKARATGPPWGRGAAAPQGALRAIDSSARPRFWRTFGPRRLRRQYEPALAAAQGGGAPLPGQRH